VFGVFIVLKRNHGLHYNQIPGYSQRNRGGYRGGEAQRSPWRVVDFTSLDFGTDANLVVRRKTALRENCKPRVLYILVCIADFADVLTVSFFAETTRVHVCAIDISRWNFGVDFAHGSYIA
jgi:hypothetical protein